MVRTTLRVFAQLLESALSVHEVGPHLDEILLYLKVLFTLEPSCAVKCVTLCLKSLFGLNLAGLMSEYVQQQVARTTTAAAATTTSTTTTASASSTSSSSQLSALSLADHLNPHHHHHQSFKPTHNRTQSSSISTLHQHQQQQINNVASLSGFSSVLSTSMSSLASLSHSNTFNQLAANCWNTTTSNNKRQRTSLFAALVETRSLQFNKFMYGQSVQFRQDHQATNQMQFAASHLLR
jgi:hypothetical protein